MLGEKKTNQKTQLSAHPTCGLVRRGEWEKATHLNCIFELFVWLSLLSLFHTAWREVLGRKILWPKGRLATLVSKGESHLLRAKGVGSKAPGPSPRKLHSCRKGNHRKGHPVAPRGRVIEQDHTGSTVASGHRACLRPSSVY